MIAEPFTNICLAVRKVADAHRRISACKVLLNSNIFTADDVICKVSDRDVRSNLKKIKFVKLMGCYRSCFLEENGNILSLHH